MAKQSVGAVHNQVLRNKWGAIVRNTFLHLVESTEEDENTMFDTPSKCWVRQCSDPTPLRSQCSGLEGVESCEGGICSSKATTCDSSCGSWDDIDDDSDRDPCSDLFGLPFVPLAEHSENQLLSAMPCRELGRTTNVTPLSDIHSPGDVGKIPGSTNSLQEDSTYIDLSKAGQLLAEATVGQKTGTATGPKSSINMQSRGDAVLISGFAKQRLDEGTATKSEPSILLPNRDGVGWTSGNTSPYHEVSAGTDMKPVLEQRRSDVGQTPGEATSEGDIAMNLKASIGSQRRDEFGQLRGSANVALHVCPSCSEVLEARYNFCTSCGCRCCWPRESQLLHEAHTLNTQTRRTQITPSPAMSVSTCREPSEAVSRLVGTTPQCRPQSQTCSVMVHQLESASWPTSPPINQVQIQLQPSTTGLPHQQTQSQVGCNYPRPFHRQSTEHRPIQSSSCNSISEPTNLPAKTNLETLRWEDPACVFVSRRIRKLGFSSANILTAYFSLYGEVKRVYVSHSHTDDVKKGRIERHVRASREAFVVMANREATAQILSTGSEHNVSGVRIRVRAFHPSAPAGESDSDNSEPLQNGSQPIGEEQQQRQQHYHTCRTICRLLAR